ncbi:hypothetical protein [Caballeronia sordidicola]|uniref:hypothetical protein n=1 Tax=Caballeronia sordidicola TaxID=196367 RepID=UPI0015C67EDE|nr:hypothetical protein [Caballeronia sordidicola]
MNKLGEFKRGWVQLVGSIVGLGVGVIGLGSYNLGLFAKDLQQSVGLSKTQYGAGYMAFTFGLALGLQVWVPCPDSARHGPQLPALWRLPHVSLRWRNSPPHL